MTPELLKITPVQLRSLGVGERWLQDRIEEDPSILGLGDLTIIRRERNQPTGGRIDFLMADPEEDTRYEVEIMLGSLDESHIIRTIEYWDIERQRYPTLEHRAVIVAEEITSRFFNVIRLLNRSVPIIAVQLNAFRIENKVVLHFTKVLDILEEAVEESEDAPSEYADRKYWETRSIPASMGIADSVMSMISTRGKSPKITFNKNHIAVGTSGYNFLWLHPRKTAYCSVSIRPSNEDREELAKKLEEAQIPPVIRRHYVKFKLTTRALEAAPDALRQVLTSCEEASHGGSRDIDREEP